MQTLDLISNLVLLVVFLVTIGAATKAYRYNQAVKAWSKKNDDDRRKVIEMSRNPERLQEALDLWSEVSQRKPPEP